MTLFQGIAKISFLGRFIAKKHVFWAQEGRVFFVNSGTVKFSSLYVTQTPEHKTLDENLESFFFWFCF